MLYGIVGQQRMYMWGVYNHSLPPPPPPPQVTTIEVVDFTSIILGLAVFAQWCCILRFLSYFDKYNMLLLTIRVAMPSVVRFIICAGILYIAFLLCGWLVLGPYHPKVDQHDRCLVQVHGLVAVQDWYVRFRCMAWWLSKTGMLAWLGGRGM